MRGENDLVIRSKRDDKVFELIPHNTFTDDLPERFIEDNVHWLNLSTGEIELRPLATMWDPSPSNWTIHFSEPRRTCSNGILVLIDIFELPKFLTGISVFEKFDVVSRTELA